MLVGDVVAGISRGKSVISYVVADFEAWAFLGFSKTAARIPSLPVYY